MTSLLQLADLNLAESLREFTRWSAEGQIVEQDGLLLTVGAHPFPAINDVMRSAAGTSLSAVELLDRATTFFLEKKHAFGVRTRAHLDHDLIEQCRARGYFELSASPGLGITARIEARLLPTAARDSELRVVTDAQAAVDFATVCSASYGTIGLPPEVAARIFSRIERALQPHVHIVVAYDGPTPVSAAMAFLSHGIGGVYWVGTVPSARKRSLAAHCTNAVTSWCFDQGASAVVLQASKQGNPIYRALGFTEHTTYPWFLCNPMAGAGEK